MQMQLMELEDRELVAWVKIKTIGPQGQDGQGSSH